MTAINIIIAIALIALLVWQISRWANGNAPLWLVILQGLVSLLVIPAIIWLKNLPLPTAGSNTGTTAARKAVVGAGNWVTNSDTWQLLFNDWWPWTGILLAIVAIAILWRVGTAVVGTGPIPWWRLVGETLIGLAVVGIALWLIRLIQKEAHLPSAEEIWQLLRHDWMPWSAITIGGLVLLLVLRLMGSAGRAWLLPKAAVIGLIVLAFGLISSLFEGCQGIRLPNQSTTATAPKEVDAMLPVDVNNVNWTKVTASDWSTVIIRAEPGKPVLVYVPNWGTFEEHAEQTREVAIPSAYMSGERFIKSLGAPVVKVRFLKAAKSRGG